MNNGHISSGVPVADQNIGNLIFIVETTMNQIELLKRELESPNLSEARQKSALTALGKESELLSATLGKLHSAYENLPEPPQAAAEALERVSKHDWLSLGLMFLDGMTNGLCDRCGGVHSASDTSTPNDA